MTLVIIIWMLYFMMFGYPYLLSTKSCIHFWAGNSLHSFCNSYDWTICKF